MAYTPPSSKDTDARPHSPSASMVETTHIIQPSDTNVHGTAFGGKIMQWMDVTAAVSAARHARAAVVTASVDHLNFNRPIRMGDVVIIKSCVNYTGRTSMEVGVRVDRENLRTGEREHCLSGYFTFVAVDREGKPQNVPPLELTGDVETRRLEAAKRRRAFRLEQRRARVS